MSDSLIAHGSELSRRVWGFVRDGFTPRFGAPGGKHASNPLWKQARKLGSELWLDSGDMDEIAASWTAEFTSLTTNNTLLNKEVQKGTYDDLIVAASALLDEFPELDERQRRLEMAFILNARHGLKLVERFDAFVSVEEHTDLADDVEAAVEYGLRYHAVCPERFFVKVPFSPAGLLATRRLSDSGVPVNHTLGFSARQNYIIGRIGRPAFVNVFLGRLNSFVADNGLGDGTNIGERATLASQAVIRHLPRRTGAPTRQIGASFRDAKQVRDLAGIDVMTIPPKVARQFLEMGLSPDDLRDRTQDRELPRAGIKDGVKPEAVGLNTLWEVHEGLVSCVDALAKENVSAMTPERLVEFFQRRGCGDILVDWTDEQRGISAEEGKIPRVDNWRELLASHRIGLDSLMNLAGFNSFAADQAEMDHRVEETLGAKR